VYWPNSEDTGGATIADTLEDSDWDFFFLQRFMRQIIPTIMSMSKISPPTEQNTAIKIFALSGEEEPSPFIEN